MSQEFAAVHRHAMLGHQTSRMRLDAGSTCLKRARGHRPRRPRSRWFPQNPASYALALTGSAWGATVASDVSMRMP